MAFKESQVKPEKEKEKEKETIYEQVTPKRPQEALMRSRNL